MATSDQISKLRRRLQDFYDLRTGATLTTDQQAFSSTELEDLIDDAFLEATDGQRGADNPAGDDEAMVMLLAKSDGLLMIAQDEARRIKWQVNNKIVDPSMVAQNLLGIAKEARMRYENARKRKLTEEIEGVNYRNQGGRMVMNTSVSRNSDRDFNNSDVRRNKPRY